ncbi:hypothetical protein GW17_00009844 [Ensete ventricosum]|nr:hypothetical protein GW17_00009844 [Ensete ventricosum]
MHTTSLTLTMSSGVFNPASSGCASISPLLACNSLLIYLSPLVHLYPHTSHFVFSYALPHHAYAMVVQCPSSLSPTSYTYLFAFIYYYGFHHFFFLDKIDNFLLKLYVT